MMAPDASRLRKAWASISKKGIRAGSRDALARWLRGALSVDPDVLHEYSWVLTPNAPSNRKQRSGDRLEISWLIPDVGPGVGGLFNIFRAIHLMEQWSHRHHIYIVCNPLAIPQKATELARKNYFPITSNVEVFNGQVADSDALVATSWQTAYAARGLRNNARKFYFVQDLEHLFFAPGSLSEFARQTYGWGFHGITAGDWIADVLRNDFGMNSTVFSFSYDRDVYSPQGSSMLPEGKKRVLFYARPSTERRGFELGILALSIVAKQLPDTEFVLVGYPNKGSHLPFKAFIPGVLKPLELAALYRSCTAALILSFTNLSLLPLEVIACGCPVISNKGPNVEWLLQPSMTCFADPVPQELAAAILKAIQNHSYRLELVEAGLKFAQKTDWRKEIKAIEAGFYQGLTLSAPEHASA
jgi:glycosyltransferase involved in cell wall biosynthesis